MTSAAQAVAVRESKPWVVYRIQALVTAPVAVAEAAKAAAAGDAEGVGAAVVSVAMGATSDASADVGSGVGETPDPVGFGSQPVTVMRTTTVAAARWADGVRMRTDGRR